MIGPPMGADGFAALETTPGEHADDLRRLSHPEQARTLVAHEPPAFGVLPDREPVLAACADIHDTYLRGGFGPAMAKFIAILSQAGPRLGTAPVMFAR